jgi:hypothetical protein
MATQPSSITPSHVWAARCLVFLGVEKALAAAFGLGILLSASVGRVAPEAIRHAVATHPTLIGSTAFLWYGANAVFAILVAAALRRRRRWAKPAAILFGAFHAFGIVGFMLFGPIVLLNGLLGILVAVLTLMSA